MSITIQFRAVWIAIRQNISRNYKYTLYTYKYLQNLTKYPKFVQILISNGKIQFVGYESQVRHDHVAAILLRMFIVCLLTLSITLSIIFIIIS